MKKKILKRIVYKQSKEPFTFQDLLNVKPQPDDLIDVCFVDEHYSENESWECHYVLTVSRMIEETDEEYASRKKLEEIQLKMAKQNRHAQYLKLKKEFEEEC